MLTTPFQGDSWSFDVGSLMVLVGESEEHRYRLSLRNFALSIAAAPAVGLQTYLRSYDLLLDTSPLTYHSPSGCNSAELRNMRLDNFIRALGLLNDGKCRFFNVQNAGEKRQLREWSAAQSLIWLWVLFTWVLFGGLMVFLALAPSTTWVGFASCLAITVWSIVLRVIEYHRIEHTHCHSKISDPEKETACFILGRGNSALVLRGTRESLVKWTGTGPTYKESDLFPTPLSQAFTRAVSLMVLLFVFATVPNGSTIDQLIFVIINLLGQANTMLGQELSARRYLRGSLKEAESEAKTVETRTHVYAELIKSFRVEDGDDDWVEAIGMLPKTAEWTAWRQKVQESSEDAKSLYTQIIDKSKRKRNETSAAAVCGGPGSPDKNGTTHVVEDSQEKPQDV